MPRNKRASSLELFQLHQLSDPKTTPPRQAVAGHSGSQFDQVNTPRNYAATPPIERCTIRWLPYVFQTNGLLSRILKADVKIRFSRCPEVWRVAAFPH